MTHYDRIAASAPINRQAAQSFSKGSEWTPIVQIIDYFPDMPPMKRIDPALRRSANFQDFEGMTFGRLAVLGLLAGKNSARKASWVCRCKCGGYCTRSAKSLKVAMVGGNSFVPMCGRCDYQNRLSAGWAPKIKERK